MKDRDYIIYINTVDVKEVSGQGSFEKSLISYLTNKFLDDDIQIFSVAKKNNKVNNKHYEIGINKSCKLSYLMYQIKLFYFLVKEIYNNKDKNIKMYVRISPVNIVPFMIGKFCNIEITSRSGPFLQNLEIRHKVSKYIMPVFKTLLNFYFKNTSKIIVVTNKIKDVLIDDFNLDNNDIIVIPNPVDNNLFNKKVNQKFLSKENSFTISYIGSLYELQGVMDLIYAMNDIVNFKKIREIKLVIVGAGPLFETIQNKIKEFKLENYITMIGNIPKEEIVKYIVNSNVCVATYTELANHYKGSSALKIMEYLYFNKFIIAANIEDYQFIEENKFGILYEVDNHKDLSLKIIDSFSNQKQLSINSKEYVIKNRTQEHIFDLYIKIILGFNNDN